MDQLTIHNLLVSSAAIFWHAETRKHIMLRDYDQHLSFIISSNTVII